MAELLYTDNAQLPPQSSVELSGHVCPHPAYVNCVALTTEGNALPHQHSAAASSPAYGKPAALQASRHVSTVNLPPVPTCVGKVRELLSDQHPAYDHELYF